MWGFKPVVLNDGCTAKMHEAREKLLHLRIFEEPGYSEGFPPTVEPIQTKQIYLQLDILVPSA